MTIYEARRGQLSYGYPIGLIGATWHIPFAPGDIGNASTFDFPVRYAAVDDLDGQAILNGSDLDAVDRVIEAALQLQGEGVRAITSNCGFMAAFQPQVAEALDIPVFLSSLQQLPMLTTMIGASKKLGVVTANAANVTDELLKGAGVGDRSQLHMIGLEEYEHFREFAFEEKGLLDTERMEAEVVDAVTRAANEVALSGIFLECSDLPPYSKAVHEATKLPVWDWAQFINYVYAAVAPKAYTGLF